MKHIRNRTYQASLDLSEYPWIRGTYPNLRGAQSTPVYHADGKVQIRVHSCIYMHVFPTVGNRYCIQLHARVSASPADIRRAVEEIDEWIKELDVPKSCEVDPHTGKHPSLTIDNNADYW